MEYFSHAEAQFIRRHINRVRHITLDPAGPGAVRLHLVPCHHPRPGVPFTLILNGQDVLPLHRSWAILLVNLMDAMHPHEGEQLDEAAWQAAQAQAVQATLDVYPGTPRLQIEADLAAMMDCFYAIAQGKTPPIGVQPMDLGHYAPHMAAPHRMDLMISSMQKDGAWHCNQKCLHCYAANQPLGTRPELDTDQWLAIIEKCRAAGVPQLTFTGGEPTLRHDLVKLVRAAQWFVTRLNTNGRMLTSHLCKELYEAGLDAVQVTLYSADEAVHNELVGAAGFQDTVNGIQNALAAGLNVSINTPLCTLNQDYAKTVAFAQELGLRYLSCSGLIPAGNACTEPSRAARLTPAALQAALRPAMAYATAHEMELRFTSPGWLSEDDLHELGFTFVPSCGACLSNMAVAPDGTVLPCQSWLSGDGLGNILRTPWHRIWNGGRARAIRRESAKMLQRCPLGETPQEVKG